MSKTSGDPNPAAELIAALDLERLEDNLFRGVSLHVDWQRVYGGQVLGQALAAATRTCEEDRKIHSLHGYFLLAGNPKRPIVYDVEYLRDGGSFSTRRVKAIQHGQVIFVMSASFHRIEEGMDHQSAMPDVPPPEDLPSAKDIFSKAPETLPDIMRNFWKKPQPIDMRPVDLSRYLTREKRDPRQYIWLKAASPLPDNPTVHQCALAYASDFTLLDTALIAHGKLMFDRDVQLASLDHALWFHRPVNFNEWLLYAQDSPSAYGARGFCRGEIFDRNGALIASTAQEGLMRQRLLK